MKTRDLVADLISEIADETDHSVCRFESVAPSTGHIVYIYNDDHEDADEDEILKEKYKILDYVGDIVYIWGSDLSRPEIDLKDPNSIDIIKDWFLDHSHAYDNPAGVNNTATSYGPGSGGNVTLTGGCASSSGSGGSITITAGSGTGPVNGGWASTTTTSPWIIGTNTSTTFKNSTFKKKNGI